VLIPSIDLMNGRIVQLEQGRRLVLETDDVDGWIARFAAYPLVQVIDLDAAMDRGHNDALVQRLCLALPCQIGGGIRTVARAQSLLDAGARRVIAGSSLYSRDGVNVSAARAFADRIPVDRLVAAIDSRSGQVVIHGWKTMVGISPEAAARTLEPYVGTFLYTHVDTEGLLQGINMPAVLSVAAATSRRLIAAGGIRSQQEIDALDARGIDAVVGMAIYKRVLTEPGIRTESAG
jgi:phosphoribosylformimino-5-aminoimidazole carboxamide ribotide isomerase